MFYQIISLVGALLLLVAYGGSQMGVTGPHDRLYSLANLVGASLLLWVAIVDLRLGFILLEIVWVLMSLQGLVSPRPPVQNASGA